MNPSGFPKSMRGIPPPETWGKIPFHFSRDDDKGPPHTDEDDQNDLPLNLPFYLSHIR
jgi:hypothetical protein